LLPVLGKLPIAGIGAPLLIETLRSVERRGAQEVVAKLRVALRGIFGYAINVGQITADPATTLRGAFVPAPVVHRATIPLRDLPQLFRALAKVPAELNTKLALYWLMLTACRTAEMRFATWSEIEHDNLWRVPAAPMKMTREHVVPLSKQAVHVLKRATELRTSHDGSALRYGSVSCACARRRLRAFGRSQQYRSARSGAKGAQRIC